MEKSYAEKLTDPRWQRVRLAVWERAGFQCENCCDTKRKLDVHHCYYESRKDPWDYPLESLLLLCDKCHKEWHKSKLSVDKMFAGVLADDIDRIQGLIAGALASQKSVDVFFDKRTDPITAAGAVRGFWVPAKFQAEMIDAALLRISRSEEFWLSDIVAQCIPLDDAEYHFIASWYDWAVSDRNSCHHA